MPQKLQSGAGESDGKPVELWLSDHMALAVAILLPILFFVLMKAISQ